MKAKVIKSKRDPFNAHHDRYESWFTHHQAAYHSELLAVRALLAWQGLGLEIGVGTGRFAVPPGVKVGVVPSMAMLAYAAERGALGIQGIARDLPFKNTIFDFALVVITICFVGDGGEMLVKARRVLKPCAPLAIGFVDRDSTLARYYLDHNSQNVFHRDARFYSASEVGRLLRAAGFDKQTWGETLAKPLKESREIDPFREGHENGGFAVVSATQ